MMHDAVVKGILSATGGMNLYRGCTHGCIYCDSRSTCYQMKHRFEDIEIKRNAPQLLEQTLRRKRNRCVIATGSMCDPYLPLEATECLTRRCLEIIEEYGFGLSILTKSDLLLRDLPLLQKIDQKAKTVVCTTLTTYDETLCGLIEPNVCSTASRAAMLKTVAETGIDTAVWLCPILPFINDSEENLRGILSGCFKAKVKAIVTFGMGVTLRDGSRQYFYQKLEEHFPGMKERYLRAFGNRYECPSPHAARLMEIFERECRAHQVIYRPQEALAYLKRYEDHRAEPQLSLF